MEEQEELRFGNKDELKNLEIETQKLRKRKRTLDRLIKDDDKSFSLEDLDEEIRDHVLDLDISLADRTGIDNFNLNSTFRSNMSDSKSNTQEHTMSSKSP